MGVMWLILGIVLVAAPVDPMRPLDRRAETWLDEALLKGAGVYATARILNGSISVLQDSELQVSPAGVGASVAVGQILDPLNDMTERFSSVVVTALSVLALERMLHRFIADLGTPLLGLFALMAGLLSLLIPQVPRLRVLSPWVAGGLALLVAVRLAAPLAALGGQAVHTRYFQGPLDASKAQLQDGLVDLDIVVRLELPEGDGGMLGQFRQAGRFLSARVEALRTALFRLRDRLDDLVGALLSLTGLYLAQILLQGVLLPLAMFATIRGFAKLVFRMILQADPLRHQA